MDTLSIVTPKHPALHTPANIDPFTTDINWVEREQAMLQLMVDKFGIGLASPQVGESHNMFVMRHSLYGEIGVYNPEIVSYSEDNVTLEEGCLTFPLLFLNLTRPASVDVRYYKNDGIMVEDTFTGMDARCYQHEYEHLQGELFIDRASNMKLQRAFTKREKLFKTLERQVK